MTRSPVCSPLLGCACRRRRPGWSTSTTGSTSWAFTSSAGPRRGPPGSTSTPIPRRRRWPPSWERCGRSRPENDTPRSPSCWSSSTGPCGGGATTSGTECRRHLLLPRPVHLAAGEPVATQTTRRDQLEDPLPAVPDRQARTPPSRGKGGALPRLHGAGHPLPLARPQHLHAMDERVRGEHRVTIGDPWRARCAETRSAGSEGGSGKRAGRDPGTAPRPDPYTKLHGPAKWSYFYLYVILDIYSRYVVGWMVASRESAALAETLIRQTCAKQNVRRDQLPLHADRGSSMTSKPVALLLADLGVTQSHSRPHVSNDNPYSEAQFKTLKYRPDFPTRFASIEAARVHCQTFFGWYNDEHRHTGLGLHVPADVHYGRAQAVHAERASVLDAAYAAHPERFVHKPPAPPSPPTASWINEPEPKEPAAQ